MAYAAALPRLFGTRGRRVTLLCLAVLLVDQVSKAIRPTGTFTVNAGGAAILPSFLGDALWRSPTIGAACDTVDTVLLLAALGRVRRLTNTWQRTAATAVLAGLLSNLVDRLGGSSVFHPGLPRGSIDWIPVPAWPTARTNIADVIIALGVLALLYHPARHALLAVHDLARRTRAAQLGAATVGLIAVAIWTTMWQANRNTMEHHPTPQSETFAQCATSYPSDGMDWVSYRPTAGPPPYHPPTPQQTVPRCAKTTPTEIPQCAQARAKLRLPHTSGPESPRPGLGPGGCGDRIGPGHADRRGGRQGGSRRYGPLRRQRLGRTRTRRRGQRRVLLQHPLLQRHQLRAGIRADLLGQHASVQRGVSLPVFADAGVGDVHIATVPNGQLALFGGYRFLGQTRQGVAYPLDPPDWLAHACSIVRRDLTPTEWAVYLPGQSYRPTCNG
jgi:hypothetical protein